VKLHTKKLKTPKMARRKIEDFGIKKTKTKNLPNSQEERQIRCLPPYEILHEKLKTPKMTRRKLKTLELQNTKNESFKVHEKKGKYLFSSLAKFHTKKKTKDSQNDKKKNQRVRNFKILEEKSLKVHKSKTPPPFHNKKKLKEKIEDPKL
jgi:hypothetical protein